MNNTYFKYLDDIESEFIANFIENEHPQTIALILSNINPSKAADILEYLSEDLKVEIIIRISNMGYFSSSVINRISKILEKNLRCLRKEDKPKGIEISSDILKKLDIKENKKILISISQIDLELSNKIKKSIKNSRSKEIF